MSFNNSFPATVNPQLTCRTTQQDALNSFEAAYAHGFPHDGLRTPSRESRRISFDECYTPPQLSSGLSSAASSFDLPSTPGDFSTETSLTSSRRASMYSPCPHGDGMTRFDRQTLQAAWSEQASLNEAPAASDRNHFVYPCSNSVMPYKEPSWLLSEQCFPGQHPHTVLNTPPWGFKQENVNMVEKINGRTADAANAFYHLSPHNMSYPSFAKPNHNVSFDFPSNCDGPTSRSIPAPRMKGSRARKGKTSSRRSASSKSKDQCLEGSLSRKQLNCPTTYVSKTRRHVCNMWNPKENKLCDKSFHRPEHLGRHQDSHSTQKIMYGCPLCPKEIESRPDNMKSHLKNTHYTPTEQKEEKGKVNKRMGMLATFRTFTDGIARPRWNKYFKGTKKDMVIKDDDLPGLILKDDPRWCAFLANQLTVDHRLKKQKSETKEEQDGTKPAPESKWWKMVDWPVEYALQHYVKEVAPEWEGPADTVLWQLDPRYKALEAGTFKVEDCPYLLTTMREMRKLGLDHLDPRWIALREGTLKMERKEAIVEGIEELWSDIGLGDLGKGERY